MRRRRGISEIVSTIIIISVVVAGLGIYTGLSQQRILGDTLTVKEALEQKDSQISELLEHVDMFRITDSHGNNDIVGVFIHNSGLKNVTISQAYVNGTIDMNDVSNPVYVRDLSGNQILPNNKIIPIGKTSEIILNFTGHTPNLDGITGLVIKTDSNKLMQFLNDTQ